MTATQRGYSLKKGIALVMAFAIVYLLALALYANSGRSVVGKIPPEVKNGINLSLQLVSVDSLRREITMRVAAFPEGDYISESGIGFAKPMRFTFWQAAGDGSSKYVDAKVGQPYVLTEVKFLVNGNPNLYPKDHYVYGDSDVDGDSKVGQEPFPFISVVELDSKGMPAASVTNQLNPEYKNVIPLGLAEDPEGASGWSEIWNLSTQGSTLLMFTTFKRAGGTLIFVVVVMVMMAVLAAAALSVSIRVYRKPGTIEATMASWQAALLFALVPLRNFLPGAPPIGAWIDMLVFYWVELALMVSMALFTYTWLRDRGHLKGEVTWSMRHAAKKAAKQAAKQAAENSAK